jgi:hypothetical protein
MEESKIKLRLTQATDVKSIIELLAQLDRPLPKDKYETKKFQKLIESYLLSSSTKGNREIILATTDSKIMNFITI